MGTQKVLGKCWERLQVPAKGKWRLLDMTGPLHTPSFISCSYLCHAHMRSSQSSFRHGWGGLLEVLPPAEKLLALDSGWKGYSIIFRVMATGMFVHAP